ncbi:MAG: DUF5666 domain-containing protein [Chloroflexota bacterium]
MSRRVDPKLRALEVCLQSLQTGADAEELLAAYPRYAEELRPLLHASQLMRQLAPAGPPPELAQEHSRADFLEMAQRMLPPSPRRWLAPLGRALFYLLLLILGLALLAGGLMIGASYAMPGGLLYPVQLAGEQARLSLTRDAAQRLELEKSFDRQHLAQVQRLAGRGQAAPVDFSAGLSQMQGETWQVGELSVIVPPDARLVGSLAPGFYVNVLGELRPDGSILARQIQPRQYHIVGELQALTEEHLVVSGLEIRLTSDSVFYGQPAPGERVQVWALLSLEQALQARLVETLD